MVHVQMNEPRGESCGLLATRVLGLSPTLGPFPPVLRLSRKARGHTHIVGVGVLLCYWNSVCMCLKWRKKKKNWVKMRKPLWCCVLLCRWLEIWSNLILRIIFHPLTENMLRSANQQHMFYKVTIYRHRDITGHCLSLDYKSRYMLFKINKSYT